MQETWLGLGYRLLLGSGAPCLLFTSVAKSLAFQWALLLNVCLTLLHALLGAGESLGSAAGWLACSGSRQCCCQPGTMPAVPLCLVVQLSHLHDRLIAAPGVCTQVERGSFTLTCPGPPVLPAC